VLGDRSTATDLDEMSPITSDDLMQLKYVDQIFSEASR
jgi:acetyl-CoA carboxylase alpha subunit